MKLAVHLAQFTVDGGTPEIASTIASTARVADEAGVSALTVMDHWFQMESMAPAEDPMLDAYSTLAFLAAHTNQIRLATLVTGVTYRPPGLLAKTVATLDVLSGGRAMLGIGAAWYEREHDGLGVPFPALSERFERLEEAIQICHQMWSDDNGAFTGEHYQLAETLCSPAPIQQPKPPIMIGGSGEKKTLRLVARYGDACNLFAFDYDQVAHKLGVLARHCDDEQRDIDAIEKTIITGRDPLDDIDAFLTEMHRYAEIGIDTVWVGPPGPGQYAWISNVVEKVLPSLTEL